MKKIVLLVLSFSMLFSWISPKSAAEIDECLQNSSSNILVIKSNIDSKLIYEWFDLAKNYNGNSYSKKCLTDLELKNKVLSNLIDFKFKMKKGSKCRRYAQELRKSFDYLYNKIKKDIEYGNAIMQKKYKTTEAVNVYNNFLGKEKKIYTLRKNRIVTLLKNCSMVNNKVYILFKDKKGENKAGWIKADAIEPIDEE